MPLTCASIARTPASSSAVGSADRSTWTALGSLQATLPAITTGTHQARNAPRRWLLTAETRDIREGVSANGFAGQKFTSQKAPAALDPNDSILFIVRRRPSQALQPELGACGCVGSVIRRNR